MPPLDFRPKIARRIRGFAAGSLPMRSVVWVQLFLFVPTIAVGCDRAPHGENGPDPGSPDWEAAFTVHDSAGVEIVVNHAPEHPRGQFWTIDPNPLFSLGGSAGVGAADGGTNTQDSVSAAIWRVSGLARLVDGRVAVLSSENRELYLFEPSGALSRTIGRRGRGPGEFSRPRHLRYLPPDTLVVWDHWMGPVTRFDTAGRVLDRRTTDLGRALAELPDQASAESRTYPVPDGSFIVSIKRREASGRTRPRDYELVRHHPEEYVRLDKEYVAISFGTWGGRQHWAVPEEFGRASPISHYQLMADDYFFNTDLTSHIAVGGHPASVYISSGDRNEIQQFSLDGVLVRIIRRTTSPVPVTEQARRARAQNGIRFLSVFPEGEWRLPLIEATPKSETYPPVHGLLVDLEGHLWVREWSESETGLPDRWSVFNPEGRWLGFLDEPPPTGLPDLSHCHLCWIGTDSYVTVRIDEWGAERVEVYRILRDG